MKTVQLPSTETFVLDRLLDPLTRSLTPAAVRALIGFRVDAADQARIAELAEKCNEGELNAKERAEYEAYVRAGDFIATLQSNARRLLKTRKS